jgi:hypothetical protein
VTGPVTLIKNGVSSRPSCRRYSLAKRASSACARRVNKPIVRDLIGSRFVRMSATRSGLCHVVRARRWW